MVPFLSSNADQLVRALDLSMAIIEFDPSGKVLKANKNFCELMGYSEAELIGKHHRTFVDTSYAQSVAYEAFWQKLRGGAFECSEFKRVSKSGQEIYIRGNYNPIKDRSGKVLRIVKVANDITKTKLDAIESAAKLGAISRAQATIEFAPDGTILTANENFLQALGYRLTEIVGQHHSMFVERSYVGTAEYADFWKRLASGEFVSDEFKRIGKSGQNVFIQASYNPIFDLDGKVFKVVKFATNVTERVRNVDDLASNLTALAGGDLSGELRSPFIPALDRLRLDFNSASRKLRTAMTTVAENARAISAGSNEIKTSADDLAKRTEQQAASVEETAAALEEITTTVKDSSRRAEEAGRLVDRTKSHAEHSGQVVTEAIQAMDQIEASSRAISNIIGVIDEIAFQTNLLALNAGVEAARAGEAGKGFAVVAQEVRELAQRSAKAAKEIKTLITASSAHVSNGVALVTKAGGALQEIASNVAAINADISAIVDASKEQAIALGEINQAVNTVDQGTQKNAAMVEEQTAASHGLAGEAQALFELLDQFRFDDGTTRSAAKLTLVSRPPVSQPQRKLTRAGGTALAEASWEEF